MLLLCVLLSGRKGPCQGGVGGGNECQRGGGRRGQATATCNLKHGMIQLISINYALDQLVFLPGRKRIIFIQAYSPQLQ